MITKLSLFITESTDPYRNLAFEKYLTFHTQPGECILYLWQNRQTVVIGRNQNCWKECNVSLLEKEGGHLARRLSGGGAVFHDLGNLNFTFCVRREEYDVQRQLDVILAAVRALGIEAEKSGRNDVLADGRKFSGNAFFRSGDYCYHHGTLMISTDPEQMQRYLRVSSAKLRRNGVDSVRSRVVNLKDLNPAITVRSMEEALREASEAIYSCPAEDLPAQRLDSAAMDEEARRFSSWEWKYGRKIPFTSELTGRFSWGSFEVQLQTEGGCIKDAVVHSDSMYPDLMDRIPEAWKGCRYDAREMAMALWKMEETRMNETKDCPLNEMQDDRAEKITVFEDIRSILEEQL